MPSETTNTACTLEKCSTCGNPTKYETAGLYISLAQEIRDLYPEIEASEYLLCWPCFIRSHGIKLKGDLPSFTIPYVNLAPPQPALTQPIYNPQYHTQHACLRCGRQGFHIEGRCTVCRGETTG